MCLSDTSAHTQEKLQNRLRRVLVFDTSRAFSLSVQKRGLVVRRVLVLIQVKCFLRGCKTAKWHLRVCLSLLQVEVDFFVDERSVCFIIQVELIFGLKICF